MIPRERARQLLPQVLLTLLSILQALALEILWTRATTSEWLFGGGAVALAGWLQVLAVVQGIVLTWLLYVGLVLRFTWVPATRDSVLPFAIGLLEFTLIELCGPGREAAWLLVLSAIFVLASLASSDIYARVLDEPENRRIAARLPRPSRADRLVPMAFAVLLWLCAALVAASGGAAGAVLPAAVAANAALLAQAWIVHRYTTSMIAPRPAGAGRDA